MRGKEKKIAVIGDGAMGVLFGSLLSEYCPVTIFSRNEERTALRNESGITVNEKAGKRHFHPCFTVNKEEISDSSLVILFVKSYATEKTIEEYLPFIAEDAFVMTLQNGAGHLEEAERFFPSERIIIGVTEENSSLLSVSEINRGSSGKTVFGMHGMTPPCWIAKVFDEAGLEAEVSSTIMKDIWRKLLTNSSLSTATALLMASIDSFGKSKRAFSIIEALLAEAITVAEAEGYSFSFEEVRSVLALKCKSSHNAYTSIYMDLQGGRRTEVDYITGYVVSRAESHGIAVPYQKAALEIIHAKEEISSSGC